MERFFLKVCIYGNFVGHFLEGLLLIKAFSVGMRLLGSFSGEISVEAPQLNVAGNRTIRCGDFGSYELIFVDWLWRLWVSCNSTPIATHSNSSRWFLDVFSLLAMKKPLESTGSCAGRGDQRDLSVFFSLWQCHGSGGLTHFTFTTIRRALKLWSGDVARFRFAWHRLPRILKAEEKLEEGPFFFGFSLFFFGFQTYLEIHTCRLIQSTH